MKPQISFWQLTDCPFLAVLQIGHANNAEMLAQDAGGFQQVIGVRIARIAAPFRSDGCRADDRNRLFVRKLRRAEGREIQRCWLRAELLTHCVEYRTAPQMIWPVENTLCLAHIRQWVEYRLRAVLVLPLGSQRGIAAHRADG